MSKLIDKDRNTNLRSKLLLRAIPEKKHLGEEDGTFIFTQPPMEFNFLWHQPPMYLESFIHQLPIFNFPKVQLCKIPHPLPRIGETSGSTSKMHFIL